MMTRYGLENAPDGTRTDFETREAGIYILTLTKSEKARIEKDFHIKLSQVFNACIPTQKKDINQLRWNVLLI